jgi:dsDNA-specific endonuclease/ATPase MutS2
MGHTSDRRAHESDHHNVSDEPLPLPIDGTLDLHTFRPAEIPALLEDYIDECQKRGITTIRIVHGKGIGTLRELVHARLKKNPAVTSFRLAQADAGGWGATIATVKGSRTHPPA